MMQNLICYRNLPSDLMYLQSISFDYGYSIGILSVCVNDARRRQFDAFRVISRLDTRFHWIRHTQKPLHSKFHVFYVANSYIPTLNMQFFQNIFVAMKRDTLKTSYKRSKY